MYPALDSSTTDNSSSEFRPAALADVFDQFPEDFLFADSQGAILYVNPSFELSTGYQSGQIVGKSLKELVKNWGDGKRYAEIILPLSKGETWRGIVVESTTHGSVYSREVTVQPVHDGEGAVVGFAAMAHDTNKDARDDARILQSQKMEAIGQLASGIAHEINTPTQYIGDNVLFIQETASHVLALLGQYAQLLDAAKEGNNPQALMKEIEEKIEEVDLEFLLEELPGAIERTLEGNQRVAEVVRAMKEFAHPDAEGMSPFDLNRSVVSTIAVARNEWKYVADLKTELDDSLPLVRCIQGAFNQAILNLIVNAAHAVEESLDGSGKTKGLITVSTNHDDSFVVVKVSDNGTGMSPDVLDRMYNPFFTTKAVGKGTGQGLAIVRSVIIDTQNGTLDCESEVGKGTTFTVRIPLGQTNG